ncbi:MAG TPA: VWA domain-containing protein [Planctomycetota bacterium]|nr:VWA domain-containing protein [Planctomycetota bacterium]
MSFGQPWFLLLLLGLPLVVLFARWSRAGLEAGRSVAGSVVRSLLVVALAFALADAQWVSKSYRTCTLFLLDHSFSIPPDIQRKAFLWISDQLKKLPKDDSGGVIVFGEDAMIEVPPVEKPELSGPTSLVGRTATDIGAAIRLALAVFPPTYQKRIVIVSDGNENRGNAVAEAELARTQGVVIDVLALKYEYANEVWMESLLVPSDLIPKEPFDLTAVLNSQQPGPATLSIFRNGELLSHQTVQLNKGKNVFTVKQRVESAGSYAYEAVVEMAGDTISSNNSAQAFAHAQGEARIALVGGDASDTDDLAAALRDEGLQATVFQPEHFQAGRVDVADFDCVVVSNVEAIRLGQGAMQAMEAAVHDAGVGFIMIGGEHGYGPGGYRGSPIEELLPVTMEQPQRRVIPNGALCLILHTCEIADGNYWAKQIGKAALNVLGPRDYMGVLLYNNSTESWLFDMQLVQDRGKLHALLDTCQPWDMPSFELAYQKAHVGLVPVTAASKHIVVISDADPDGPTDATVDAIIKDRITVSTVAISPHGASDVARMQRTALRAGGRFYEVTDPTKLPQIFIKEAATIQRSMVIEGDIPPVVMGATDALKGIPRDAIPLLRGYTITHPKPLSRTSLGALVPKDQTGGETQFDGLLVEWTYGLGRTMAFTSDAKKRWGAHWVAWDNYRKFWSQAVRSVLRTVPRSPYAIQTQIEGGKGKVTIDAIDDQGKFIHTLQFQGSVTSPEGKKQGLAFRQVGPGRYESEFEAGAVGVYTVTGTFEGAHGEKGYLSQGVPLSYAAEYRDLKFNLSLLSQLHERTGGRRLALDTPVYVPLSRSAGVSMPLWPHLLMLVLALFPLDIFIRRVAVDWPAVGRRLARTVRRTPRPVTAAEIPASIQQLARAKQEIRAEQLPPVRGPVDLGTPSGAPPTGRPGPPVPPAAPAAAPAQEKKPAPADATPDPGGYLNRLLDAKKKSQQKPKE